MLVPGATHPFTLRTASAQIRKGYRARLELRFSQKAWRLARRALIAHGSVRARVRLTVRDAAGNAVTVQRSIRLRG
jgi:hypothetical protein